jgi:hypothetical protein
MNINIHMDTDMEMNTDTDTPGHGHGHGIQRQTVKLTLKLASSANFVIVSMCQPTALAQHRALRPCILEQLYTKEQHRQLISYYRARPSVKR